MHHIFAHMIGDYVIQNDWMASEKLKRHVPALVHAASYTVPFAFITTNWKPLAVIGGTHFVIDRYRLARHIVWLKNQTSPKAYRPNHTPTGYGLDKPD